MSIDHASLNVPQTQSEACIKFYIEALKPLGYEKRHQYGPSVAGFGSTDTDIDAGGYQKADFWIFGADSEHCQKVHFGFRSKDRASVDAFYEAALKNGAKDNGAPGLRKYHPTYYAAFVLDPAGNNIEAVCHEKE